MQCEGWFWSGMKSTIITRCCLVITTPKLMQWTRQISFENNLCPVSNYCSLAFFLHTEMFNLWKIVPPKNITPVMSSGLSCFGAFGRLLGSKCKTCCCIMGIFRSSVFAALPIKSGLAVPRVGRPRSACAASIISSFELFLEPEQKVEEIINLKIYIYFFLGFYGFLAYIFRVCRSSLIRWTGLDKRNDRLLN